MILSNTELDWLLNMRMLAEFDTPEFLDTTFTGISGTVDGITITYDKFKKICSVGNFTFDSATKVYELSVIIDWLDTICRTC